MHPTALTRALGVLLGASCRMPHGGSGSVVARAASVRMELALVTRAEA